MSDILRITIDDTYADIDLACPKCGTRRELDIAWSVYDDPPAPDVDLNCPGCNDVSHVALDGYWVNSVTHHTDKYLRQPYAMHGPGDVDEPILSLSERRRLEREVG